MGIHVEEWLQELAAFSTRSDEGHSVAEIAENTGMSEPLVRRRLRDASRFGWVRVGRRSATAIDGKNTLVPVYIVANPDNKTDKKRKS